MASFIPYLVSEREPGGWEDCTWATGVMVGNFAYGASRFPATRYEYESLRYVATGIREASGDGSTYDELETGLRIRYKLTHVRRGRGFTLLLDQMPVGSGAGVQGRYLYLPSRLRLSTFTGAHSAFFIRDRDTSGLWLDPLAENGDDPTRISISELRRYYETQPGAQWIAVYEREAYSQPMIVFNLERWKLPAGTRIYENPNGLQVTTLSGTAEVTTLGYPNDHSANGVDSAWRAVLISTKALDGITRRKIAFIRKPVSGLVPTDAAWDAAVMKALLDPTFAGGPVIDATSSQITSAQNAGFNEGLAKAEAAVHAVAER